MQFLSFCCVAAAAVLLVSVCAYCYPGAGSYGKAVFFGAEHGPAREAFSVLTESLEDGKTIRDSIARSCEVLLGQEN